MSATPDTDSISHLAYRLWEERGRPFGSPEVDWSHAEELLRQTGLNGTSNGSIPAPVAIAPPELAPVSPSEPATLGKLASLAKKIGALLGLLGAFVVTLRSHFSGT